MSKTMEGHGPQFTVDALRRETGLPIEGYFHIGMGSTLGGGSPPAGLPRSRGRLRRLSVPRALRRRAGLPGDTFIDGADALAIGRERQTLPHGDVDRTLGQGLLLKAAIAEVKKVGMLAMPALLSLMDDYVNTDLSIDNVLTFAATVYTVDPGPMPTLTGGEPRCGGPYLRFFDRFEPRPVQSERRHVAERDDQGMLHGTERMETSAPELRNLRRPGRRNALGGSVGVSLRAA